MYMGLKKNIDEIKFFLPIFLTLPPLLGGIWQLVELFNIHPSYIRFFSVTQLFPDGLLMLLVLVATTPLLLIIILLHKIIPEDAKNREVQFKILSQSSLKHYGARLV